MVKKILFPTFLGLLLGAGTAFAQPGILKCHPESLPGGRRITLEEAILSRDIHPANTPREEVPEMKEELRGPKFWNEGPCLGYEAPDGTRKRIAGDPSRPDIVFGQSVSRNEFGISGGVFPSPDGRKVAFYRKDESRVTDFPLLDITTRTGSLKSIKYPMNGMVSERIDLGVYDLESGRTVYLKADGSDCPAWTDGKTADASGSAVSSGQNGIWTPERYLTGVSWSPDGKSIFVQVVDRTQHHVLLNQYRSADGSYVRTLLREDDERWAEPLDPIHFLGRSSLFLYRTNLRHGWRNLYLCDTLGGFRRLTCVNADVAYVGNDGGSVWYTSAEVSPVENHLFRIRVTLPKGKCPAGELLRRVRLSAPERLTKESGWHDILMNRSATWYLDRWSATDNPGACTLRSADGTVSRTLAEAKDPFEGRACCEVDLGTLKSADGRYDNAYRLVKPLGFDSAGKYPVILYVYGGPHSQLVQDRWLANIRLWEMYMAQRGYVVYIQDNRGTWNRGEAYEKAINRRCGAAEMEDQMEGIRMLKAQPWVDSTRIGVHGWSYGGFMTISLMTHYPEVFKTGACGGPVIDWKWYEVMYGERYMDTPDANPEGFAATSLIPRVKDLRGRLLICQGMLDNTVVPEHALSFVRECVKNGVQVDFFPYPCAEHNVRGRDRVHLMEKISRWFDDWL